jgi:hypothetical protein
MACLAGPADPNARNDVKLINSFKELGVPEENIFMLLERQCTPKTIKANLKNITSNCLEGDILFVYLGGHGTHKNDEYFLSTWDGYTNS